MKYIFVFLVYSIMCYGFTEMIVYMRGPFGIFEKFRNIATEIHEELGELLGCVFCTSIWLSALLSALNMLVIPTIPYTPFNLLIGEGGPWWLIIMLDCLFGSGISWILFKIEDTLDSIEQKNNALISKENQDE